MQQIKEMISSEIASFRLPRYDDIPNVGLYLEQTVHYICEYLSPLYQDAVTGSMISNYVKKKMIASPIRKQYNREQIAELLFISMAKSVLSLDNIAVLLKIRKERYGIKEAYNEFCEILEQAVRQVFGLPVETMNSDDVSEDQEILRYTMIAAANKLYLEQWIRRCAQ